MTTQSENKDVAYLVLAHEDATMINILLSRLVRTGTVFLHIDKGSDIKPSAIMPLPNLHIFSEITVKWGGWSVVQATQLLAQEAIGRGFQRLTLLSGVSYPIVSDEKLKEMAQSPSDFFEANLIEINKVSKSFMRRFTTRHRSYKLANSTFARILRRASREFFLLMPRLNPSRELAPLQLTIGSQWWSVKSSTYQKSMEILSTNSRIENYFEKIECSDESFFGTLFLAATNNHINQGTTFVKWGDKGRPISLTALDEDASKKYFFARKINSDQSELIGELDTW